MKTLTVAPAFDFRAYEIDTADFADRGAARVTVRISTKNAGRQHFAWDGWVVSRGTP